MNLNIEEIINKIDDKLKNRDFEEYYDGHVEMPFEPFHDFEAMKQITKYYLNKGGYENVTYRFYPSKDDEFIMRIQFYYI